MREEELIAQFYEIEDKLEKEKFDQLVTELKELKKEEY